MTGKPLRVGFIPLVDAAALIVAVDKGFAAGQGLDVTLVREVSWSNVRDKLNIGLFDAAHLLAPVAIASSLGIGHVRVPIVAPFTLGVNGNAITVSPALQGAIMARLDGAPTDPMATARALARVVADRRARGQEPLTFGMTFPFSTHNYQLRFWMAAGGVDPDEDVRLVVLPPPYMVESLASGHVDAFCVGAPWNSVAVDLGIGHILHFVSDILVRAAEKVLAVRGRWAEENPDALAALVRACQQAAEFIEAPDHRAEAAAILGHPERIGVDPDVIRRTLDGRLKVTPDGMFRESDRYLLVGREAAARPDPIQAAWLYAQMVRWGQTPWSAEALRTAQAVFRPDLYDAATGFAGEPARMVADGIGAFAGPAFDPADIAAHLASFPIRRKPQG
ncbi:ABC transporter substrate-binding protein [Bradyrhizobium sp. U87765 SZCCT0131]|uniref:CmpA/NrtA family ABC transporter substrate-binding protein n=1 Tax=unclassified Bradyrhizobium TaxID=2631580 RepID=UPI001BA9BD30|nr:MULTISPECIES: CmpA/NrtA family ABC transporter substrate-binding protein [unclassified Bradyrhizobium]MBR1220177.1 ABC transporter substrate-binding protein [Bradyrhizobium sp. U87765 SZCCT0131]MBR1263367.1 ABC transporter substrate-binding protein [Bradyrhizobium sp. U87765 SZCCT0134]MBR1306750.1 ABC transporter substrate-binding protein [Bradyrhizobium sp. U87765 SZCCT0110]MBR1323249.1 ABC transporter substrate-binding protein [Bradyrhizobium sp. U87765 SZCCT0109]MBR1345704.1 ABC transpor